MTLQYRSVTSASGSGTPGPATLMVTMEPPADMEDEFNDWYDTEHFPQRAGLPGFLSASRWVCVTGWPRWLALYDLSSPDALQSDAYLAVSGVNGTPWSRRILPRTTGRRRILAIPLELSGSAVPPLAGHRNAAFLTLVGWSAPDVHVAARAAAALHEALMQSEAKASLRTFTSQSRSALDVWALIGSASPLHDEYVHAAAGRALENEYVHTMNQYRRYVRTGSEYGDGQ